VVLMPSGVDALRSELLAMVTEDDWEDARAGFGDPELASQ